MRLVETKKDNGYSHWEIWLDADDFQSLVNRGYLNTDCFSVKASGAGWSSVSINIRLQKDVKPEQKLF